MKEIETEIATPEISNSVRTLIMKQCQFGIAEKTASSNILCIKIQTETVTDQGISIRSLLAFKIPTKEGLPTTVQGVMSNRIVTITMPTYRRRINAVGNASEEFN